MIRTFLSVSLAWILLALPGSASGQERFVTPVSYGTLRAMFTQPVIATDGQSLFVSSDFDRKMFVWRNLPDANAAKPDLVIVSA